MKIDLSVHVSFIVGSQGNSRGRLIDVVVAHFKGFDQLKQGTRFLDVPKVNAETLNVQKEIFDVDDFVAYQRLHEHAHEPNEPILEEAILRFFACFDARGNVEMEELLWQWHGRRETIDDLHRMEAHVHVH